MLPFGKKNLVGVDIGSYSVKVVSLKGSPGSYTLSAAACFRLPRQGGSALPVTGEILSGFLRSIKAHGKDAASVMTGPSLVFRHLYLPPMPEKDLKEAVSWEIRKESSIPQSELVSDYLEGAGKMDGKASVIAFAARKRDVDSIISLFREAGSELKSIDVVPSALLASFDLSTVWEGDMNYAMLDIGDLKSTLAIFKNRKLAFVREITFGGSDITRAISAALDKDEEEAEVLKAAIRLEHGSDDKAVKVTASNVERLCSDLHRSFDYYQAQFREGFVGKLFLSGGTARLKGIETYVSEILNIPVFVDDPLRKIKITKGFDKNELGEIAPCLAVAAGLATRVA